MLLSVQEREPCSMLFGRTVDEYLLAHLMCLLAVQVSNGRT